VLIDSLVLSAASQTGSSFLQQAAFLTGGLYLCPSNAPTVQPRGAVGGSASRYVPPAVTDLTNLLLSHCLSDADTRAMLKTPPLVCALLILLAKRANVMPLCMHMCSDR
jgi:hypothetical protein